MKPFATAGEDCIRSPVLNVHFCRSPGALATPMMFSAVFSPAWSAVLWNWGQSPTAV